MQFNHEDDTDDIPESMNPRNVGGLDSLVQLRQLEADRMKFGGRIIGTLVQMDDDMEDVADVQTDHEKDTDDLVVELSPVDGYDPKHSKQWNALVAQQS